MDADPRSPRSGRSSLVRVAVWAAWLAAVGFVAWGAAVALPSGAFDLVTEVTNLTGSLAAVSMVTVGAVLVTRLPANRVGWLLWLSGFLFAYSLGASLPPTPAGGIDPAWLTWIVWSAQLAFVPAFVMAGIVLPLVFPSGHLPSPRWRPVVVVVCLATILSMVGGAFSPYSPGSVPLGIENPLAAGPAFAWIPALAGGLATLGALVSFPVAAASLIVRYRRASGAVRAQLRWLAAAIVLFGPPLALGTLLSGATSGPAAAVANIAWLIAMTGLVLLPVAIGMAVLRYRLYEIDRIISRTVAWTAVTITLGAILVFAVLGLQVLLAPVTRSSGIAVAASTLLVAALFQPVRARIQRVVDRRFNRARYDAEGVVAVLASRLRDEVDLEAVAGEVTRAVSLTVEPVAVSLWLRR